MKWRHAEEAKKKKEEEDKNGKKDGEDKPVAGEGQARVAEALLGSKEGDERPLTDDSGMMEEDDSMDEEIINVELDKDSDDDDDDDDDDERRLMIMEDGGMTDHVHYRSQLPRDSLNDHPPLQTMPVNLSSTDLRCQESL